MNSEIFFEKKELFGFFYYFKYYLTVLFLLKKNNLLFLQSFILNLYLKYFIFSINYYLNLFLSVIKEQELKKKVKFLVIDDFLVDITLPFKKSYLFYNNLVFKFGFLVKNKLQERNGREYLMHSFCKNKSNKGVLDDDTFSQLLSLLRQFVRLTGKKKLLKKPFFMFKTILLKSIPISKIIYQRRGRIFIPLTIYIFQSNIRESLGIKHIYKTSYNVHGLSKNLIENKLAISFLDILLLKINIHFNLKLKKRFIKQLLIKGIFLEL